MRRVWRRTSSSQAEPSPWRHCWTSWASCSKLPQPHLPDTCFGSARRWAFRPANVWNAKCTGNVPALGPSQPTVWLASYPLPRPLTTPCIPTSWNQIPAPRLTPSRVHLTLLAHGIKVEESAVCRSGYPCGRIPSLPFPRESPSQPVQRRQGMGSRPPCESRLPFSFYRWHLRLLCPACPALAEISSASRSVEILEHLPYDPRRLRRLVPAWPRRRARAPTAYFAQRQNSPLGYFRHLRARTDTRRREHRGSRRHRSPHLRILKPSRRGGGRAGVRKGRAHGRHFFCSLCDRRHLRIDLLASSRLSASRTPHAGLARATRLARGSGAESIGIRARRADCPHLGRRGRRRDLLRVALAARRLRLSPRAPEFRR